MVANPYMAGLPATATGANPASLRDRAHPLTAGKCHNTVTFCANLVTSARRVLMRMSVPARTWCMAHQNHTLGLVSNPSHPVARGPGAGVPVIVHTRRRIPSQAIRIVVGMRVLTFIRRVLSWLPGRLVVRACASSTGVSSRARVLNPCRPLGNDRHWLGDHAGRNSNDAPKLCRQANEPLGCHAPVGVAGPPHAPSDHRQKIPSQAMRRVSGMTFDLHSRAPPRRAIDPRRKIPSPRVCSLDERSIEEGGDV
jgi:hypothetical protein